MKFDEFINEYPSSKKMMSSEQVIKIVRSDLRNLMEDINTFAKKIDNHQYMLSFDNKEIKKAIDDFKGENLKFCNVLKDLNKALLTFEV